MNYSLSLIGHQECGDLFADKVDYVIEKLIPINDKNESISKDWVNPKVRYEKNSHGQNFIKNKV